jgi:hypothetical protein
MDELIVRLGIDDFPISTCPRSHPKGCSSWSFRMSPLTTQSSCGIDANQKWYMGTDALLTSGVTEKMLYLIRDKRSIEPTNPSNKVRKSRILMFLAVELIGFGATFAITQVFPFPTSCSDADGRRKRGLMNRQ